MLAVSRPSIPVAVQPHFAEMLPGRPPDIIDFWQKDGT